MPATMRTTRRFRWWVVAAGLLVGVVASWPVLRLTVHGPGSLEDVYSRVRVGMSQEEAVAVLNDCNWDYSNATVTTKDGRSLYIAIWAHEVLPSPHEVDHAELMIEDYGNEVYVILGRDGVVTGKRFELGEPAWKYSRDRLRAAADSDLESLRHLRRSVKRWLGLRK
jgi:hypothetical protein